MTGTVKTIRDSYFFIKATDGDYFAHETDLAGNELADLNVGDEVDFTPTETTKGKRATGVTLIKQTATA